MKKTRIPLLILVVVAGLGASVYFLGQSGLRWTERLVMSVPPSSQTPEEQRSLASLEVVNDHPFYKMTIYGDYPRYLQAKSRFYWAMGFPKPDCSSFAVLNPQGHALLGYNNDGESRPILLLSTDPSDGYASLSISAIGDGFPWFTKSFTPFASDRTRSLLLFAPYSTQSGMNEMGLAVSTMTDPSGAWTLDPEKATVGAAEARRLVLDHAKDVDEAIALLSRYNVSYQGTTVSHVLLADRSGHSALLEWVDGEMKVTRNEHPWQVSTNFRVYGSQETIDSDLSQYQGTGAIAGDSLGKNHWRYATAWETLRKANGSLSPTQSMDLLKTISIDVIMNGTRVLSHYSVVYDLDAGDVQIVTDREYQQVYRYQLQMK